MTRFCTICGKGLDNPRERVVCSPECYTLRNKINTYFRSGARLYDLCKEVWDRHEEAMKDV